MRTKVIAELGSNHNRDLDTAKRLIAEAARAGADAVKFQLWKTELQTHPKHPAYETAKANELPRDWLPLLVDCATGSGLEIGITAGDLESLVYLDRFPLGFVKIASACITFERLIRVAAAMGKPLILSTGGATWDEVAAAVHWAARARPLTLMQCTMAYPAQAEDANLKVLRGLREYLVASWDEVGFSDHTVSLTLPALAVACGAQVIEKHFTLSRNQRGPDHAHSLEPDEFYQMVKNVRIAEMALGDGEKRVLPCEEETRKWARRACYDGVWLRPSDPRLVE